MKFLITAGPTREPIDPVRYISNRSSGKMGYAIAEAAVHGGHRVTLISGPVALEPPEAVDMVYVHTAREMHDAVHARASANDYIIMAAAVADYAPKLPSTTKIKKHENVLMLELVRTPDILRSLSQKPRKNFIIGFAAETNDVDANAKKKCVEKRCDMLVANDVSRMDTGFESDENEITLHYPDGVSVLLPRATKQELAHEIIQRCLQLQKYH